MKNIKSILILIFCVLLSGTSNMSLAKRNPIDNFEEKCCAENYSTDGMLKCTQKAYKMWDTELNKHYNLLMTKLSPQEKQDLKTAQIAWLNFRDKEFKNIDNINKKLQGTMYINVQAGQKREIVKERSLELKEYYNILMDK
jgi:uncharacterized protein YecT (DUF1311 family)